MKSNTNGNGKSKAGNTPSKQNKQSGGTILGIIIGLVIGLSIAVVVALMITKTSTPFTNKLGIAKSGDAPTIQLTDPNKPLYGSSAKEIMSNANRAADVGTVPPDTNNPGGQSVAVRAPDAVKPDGAKGDPKTVKLTDPTNAKSDVDAPAYYLQVGAFRDAGDAEGVRAKLALIGIESKISSSNADGDNLYRVRVGPFDQTDTMNRMRSKLSENSIDVAVIKTPK
ncbi:cell division protein FtsN [Oxalobacteraceae bacterium GrIS 1.18]